MDIEAAYAVYVRMACHYEERQRIPELFTEDFAGGNAGFGRIRGVEAQTVFLTTAEKMGLPPEDHLWHLTDDRNLAFRARNWAGTKGEAAYFDVVGNLAFDPDRGRFCGYYGFYDPHVVSEVLATNPVLDLGAAAEGFRLAREATERYEARAGTSVPDALRVAWRPCDD